MLDLLPGRAGSRTNFPSGDALLVSASPGSVMPGACHHLAQGLTQGDLDALARFAGFRLAKVGLSPLAGEDVAQDALLAVLRGAQSSSTGRHPRPVDLADSSAFIGYLKNVIGSLVEAERRRLMHKWMHEPIEEGAGGMVELQVGVAGVPPGDLEFRDLAEQLFLQVARQAPARLRELVLAWAAHWQNCDTIPLLGRHRRCRQELRKLAARVLEQLNNPVAQNKKGNPCNPEMMTR